MFSSYTSNLVRDELLGVWTNCMWTWVTIECVYQTMPCKRQSCIHVLTFLFSSFFFLSYLLWWRLNYKPKALPWLIVTELHSKLVALRPGVTIQPTSIDLKLLHLPPECWIPGVLHLNAWVSCFACGVFLGYGCWDRTDFPHNPGSWTGSWTGC